ncbi:MAG: HAD-IA family hydrolase [Actinomycetota bacterium]|nr:HAD-IA family hydrolase [Actinomycetota bacterium]
MSAGALLVDLDGVLVDSLAAVNRTWTWWAARHGLDPKPFTEAHGRTTRETIVELAPQLDPDREAALVEEREATDLADVVALPGAFELLRSAQPLAIVTSGTRQLALARLQAAGLAAPAVLITAESVVHGKPDPEPYLLAAARLGVTPSDCTVFEDAPAGVHAGKAAGMRVVGVTTTVATAELARADILIPDLAAYLG